MQTNYDEPKEKQLTEKLNNQLIEMGDVSTLTLGAFGFILEEERQVFGEPTDF
jgi:hypothetical protein